MGFFSKLFGSGKQSSSEGTSRKPLKGSKDNPWVCEPPPHPALAKMREAAWQAMAQLGKSRPESAANNESDIDGLIAEEMKMSLLQSLYGEEGKTWKCGKRFYFENSIQTQEIIFRDGSPTIVFYTDFSKFGAFNKTDEHTGGASKTVSSTATPPAAARGKRGLILQEELNKAHVNIQLQNNAKRTIQLAVPALSEEHVTKCALACLAKLVVFMIGDHTRDHWEKNVTDMLLNSKMQLNAVDALVICRIVENETRRSWGWELEVPDWNTPGNQEANQKGTVGVELSTAGDVWIVSRDNESIETIAGLLTTVFLIANQNGWKPEGVFTQTGEGTVLKSMPRSISKVDAAKLSLILRSIMLPGVANSEDPDIIFTKKLVAFFGRGACKLTQKQ